MLYRVWAYESAALDLALRQAGTPLHEVARPRAAAGALRRLAAPRRAADDRAAARAAWTATRRCSSSSTRRTTGRRARRRGRRDRRGRVRRPQGPVRGHDRRRRARSRRSTGACSTAFPDAWIEDPHDDAEIDALLEPAPRPRHLGRDHPLRRRHRRRCRSRRGWSTSSRRASAGCARCSPPTSYCEEHGIAHVRRRPVRARRRAAGRSSTSRRSSTPTGPTTCAPGRLQRPRSARRACRTARCRVGVHADRLPLGLSASSRPVPER